MTDADRAAYEEQIATLEWRVRELSDELDLAHQATVRDRRKIAFLERERKERHAAEPSKDVQDIFDYWLVAVQKDPKRTKLTSQRKEAVRKALREGYSVYDIQRAIMGIARDPFVKDGVVYNDLTVAVRKVELYRDKADAIEERDQQEKAAVAEEARKVLIQHNGRHYSRPELPARWTGGMEALVTSLQRKGCTVKLSGNGTRLLAQCPAHDDRSPSLDAREADDGRVLIQCRSHGCTFEQICSALGVDGRIFGPLDHPRYGKPTQGGEQIHFGEAA